jgi:hypothetical protein
VVALIAVPLLVALASVVSRRYGHGRGGLVAGLPLTSGPLSVALAIDHGAGFAGRAAIGSLLGIAAATLAYAAYGVAAPRGIGVALPMMLATFAGTITLELLLPRSLGTGVALSVGAALVATRLLRQGSVDAAAPPALGVVPRVAAALLVVAVVTTTAARLGALLAGALTPLPVVTGVLTVFAHHEQGPRAAAVVLGGATRGTYAFAAFFVVVGELAGRVPGPVVYVLATAATGLVVLGSGRFAVRPTVREPTG